MVVEGGFEPPKLSRQIYSLIPLAARELHHLSENITSRQPIARTNQQKLQRLCQSMTYTSAFKNWSWQEESNPRPADYKSAALPTELCQLYNPQYLGGANSSVSNAHRQAHKVFFSSFYSARQKDLYLA
jgi:hypothetical protein